MRYYILAGEASGDLHGSRLIRELHTQDPHAQIRCWGGDLMREAGAELVQHYKDLAFMGFIEVVMHLGTILRNLERCKRDVLEFNCDVLILIDYPGFNLRMAAWAHARGIRVVYYISPQVWAWKEGRVKAIARDVDRMLVILPFEQEFYRRRGIEVTYVGHPLLEVVREAQERGPGAPIASKPIVALLPGSRRQEVSKKLPIMLQVVKRFPDYTFVVGQAPSLEDAFMAPFLKDYPEIQVLKGRTYELLQQARAALVTSGTATLETALFGVPEIVCYKGSPISYLLARQLIRVPCISLVNLIMNRPVVLELIQKELNLQNLSKGLQQLLENPETASRLQQDYRDLWERLDEGNASRKAAVSILRFLNETRAAAAE